MSFHVRLQEILTWIDLYIEWRSEEIEDPGSSFIHPGCDIYSGYKDIWYVHHCSRWSSYSKDDNFSRELSVYHQTIVCSMCQNEFIKLSMGMPTSARSWNNYEDNVLYCILLRVTFQFEKPQILIINHFTWHQKIYDLMLYGATVIDIFGHCNSNHIFP